MLSALLRRPSKLVALEFVLQHEMNDLSPIVWFPVSKEEMLGTRAVVTKVQSPLGEEKAARNDVLRKHFSTAPVVLSPLSHVSA